MKLRIINFRYFAANRLSELYNIRENLKKPCPKWHKWHILIKISKLPLYNIE